MRTLLVTCLVLKKPPSGKAVRNETTIQHHTANICDNPVASVKNYYLYPGSALGAVRMITLVIVILIAALLGMEILDESFTNSLCIVLCFAALTGLMYLLSCTFGALIS